MLMQGGICRTVQKNLLKNPDSPASKICRIEPYTSGFAGLGGFCARIGPLSQFPSDSDPSDSASAWLRVEH